MARERGRIQGGRKAKPVVLAVCEGETELEYVKFIRRTYRANWIEPRLSDQSEPMGIIDCAKRMGAELKKKGLDVNTWVLFDAESPADEKNRSYRDAIRKAISLNMKVANSSPCFEYWVLSHYAPGIMVTEPREAEIELRKQGRIPGYKKPVLPYEELWKRYVDRIPSKAMERQRGNLESLGEDPRYGRPVSYVDELIGSLTKISLQ